MSKNFKNKSIKRTFKFNKHENKVQHKLNNFMISLYP